MITTDDENYMNIHYQSKVFWSAQKNFISHPKIVIFWLNKLNTKMVLFIIQKTSKSFLVPLNTNK